MKVNFNFGYLMITFHEFDNEGNEVDTKVLFSQTYANHPNMNMVAEAKMLFPNLKWEFDDGDLNMGTDYFQLCCYPCPKINDSYYLVSWATDEFTRSLNS